MTEKTEKKIEVKLSVIQWNVIISAIKTLGFFETEEMLKTIGEQTEGSKAKGHEEITVSLLESQLKNLISFLQFMPYNVVARIIFTLYVSLKGENKDLPNEESEVEIKVEE